tara:strand:- start:157 stop:318 length:162 start_codon:yes stop_codon:yes gene_type:complete
MLEKKLKKMRNKHPYYDSDRKKRTEKFASKAIVICLLGGFIMIIIAAISKAIL